MKWQEDVERNPLVCRKSLDSCPATPSGGVEVALILDHWPVTGETGLAATRSARQRLCVVRKH